MIILETERLILRESVPGDLEDLLELLSDPKVMEYYPEPLDRDGVLAWILKNRERYSCHGFGIWNAHARADNTFLGLIGLAPMEPEGRPEASVAYLFLPRYWRRGYATEGAVACRDYALDHLGFPRVISTVRPENLRSVRVVERAGFLPAGECRLAGYRHVIYAFARNGSPLNET